MPEPITDKDGHTVEELDEIIFSAVCVGINAEGLIRRRDILAAEQR
jgi:hypothetical protein